METTSSTHWTAELELKTCKDYLWAACPFRKPSAKYINRIHEKMEETTVSKNLENSYYKEHYGSDNSDYGKRDKIQLIPNHDLLVKKEIREACGYRNTDVVIEHSVRIAAARKKGSTSGTGSEEESPTMMVRKSPMNSED